ncbi:MAG: pectate lyase, partial [Thermodesulfobacteriota bacterium]
MRRSRLVLALVLASCVRVAHAGALAPETARAVEDVLACERADGGWTYVCEPPSGPHGAATSIVQHATRVARFLGRADWDLLVLRSPGTPAAGLVLLEAYRASGEPRALAAARRAGDVLVATQLSSGGWASEMPVHGARLAWWFRLLNRWTALDDDVTSGGARFLAELYEVTGDLRHRAAAERAYDLLLAAQLPEGGWPLTWREPRWLRFVSPSFEDLPSTNDAATSGPIEALLVGARVLERPDLLAAAERGGEWLLRVQGPARQAAWAQQYEPSGAPAPGRRFEPAGYAAWESREMLDALLALARATGERRWCGAVPGAVAWFARSAIAPGCWARLYATGDNRPLFVGRDGRIVPTAAEAKRPYKWTGDFGIPALLASLRLDEHGAPLARGEPLPPRRIPGDA